MYELTVFVLIMTRENHDLAFVFFILYRFQGSVLGVSRSSDAIIYHLCALCQHLFFIFFSAFLSLTPIFPNIPFGFLLCLSPFIVPYPFLHEFLTKFPAKTRTISFLKKIPSFRTESQINSAEYDEQRSNRGNTPAYHRAAGKEPGFPCRSQRRSQ